MKMTRRLISFCTMILVSISFTLKAETVYVTASATYNDTSIGDLDNESGGFRFGVGYEFHRQWYIEAGFQSLANDDLDESLLVINKPEFDADAIYISLLGKAKGQKGELFYRLGLMQADVQGALLSVASCESVSFTEVNDDLCSFDETIMAGVIGIGFDYFINRNLLLRTEIEYVKGEKDYSAALLQLGLRYNF